MLNVRTFIRRPRGRVVFDERTGDVCTAACRAAARRRRDTDRTLGLRGPR